MTAPQPSDPRASDPLASARRLARLLDSAVAIPGTNVRFGLDALIGLVPGLGDVAGAAMSAYLVLLGSRQGISRAVLARMIGNVAVDAMGGSIPLIGDLFDVGWKANTRNLQLLERSLGDPAPAARASRAAVVGTVVVLVLIAVAALAGGWFLLRAIASAVTTGT